MSLRTFSCEGCGASVTYERTNGPLRKWCSANCLKRTWDREHPNHCLDCGRVVTVRRTRRCFDCHLKACEQKRHALYDRLRQLWDGGVSVNGIAAAIGRTPGSVNVTIARAKHEGWSFPPRRAGWNGHTKRTGPKPRPAQTPQGARQQLGHAVRVGRVVRPSRCEKCAKRGHVDGHHTDYSKPLEVEWLCRSCHAAHHIAERRAAA